MSLKFPGGKIIAFEGLDNCFKETNYRAFVRRLANESFITDGRSRDVKIITEAFPRYGNQMCVGVEKWLGGTLNRAHMKAHPEATTALYNMDFLSYWFENVHGQGEQIDKLLLDNDSVFIFDRYIFSNAIYNPLVGEDTTADDVNMSNYAWGIPSPDIIVWFRASNFDTWTQLIAEKKNKDANELDLEFLKKVWERSERFIQSGEINKTNSKLIVIDIFQPCGMVCKSKEEIANEVWNKVTDLLKGE